MDRRGFTLIELVVVLVVVAVLAAIAVPRFLEMRDRSYYATLQSDLRVLAVQQELYHKSHHAYAPLVSLVDFVPSPDVTLQVNEATALGWSATATHAGMPDRQCGVFAGDADAGGALPATIPGVIACD